MKIYNIFEAATRYKFRFVFKGVITTEDLWDLTVQDLNDIYKSLKAEERKSKEESLLAVSTPEDEVLSAKIEIVKKIVEVKLNDAKRADRAKENAERRKRLMRVMADKQDEELKSKSSEELQKMLDELQEE